MYMRLLPIPRVRRAEAPLAWCVFISSAPAPRGPGREVPAGPSTRPSSARQFPEGGAGAWGGVIHNTSNGLFNPCHAMDHCVMCNGHESRLDIHMRLVVLCYAWCHA